MLSLYQSKWLLDYTAQQLDVCNDNVQRVLQEARNAQGIREGSRDTIISILRKLNSGLSKVQQLNLDLVHEISLAKQLYDIDFPVHNNRFFSFDDAGELHEISEEQYRKDNPELAAEILDGVPPKDKDNEDDVDSEVSD